jgi:hypothetical protein
MYSVEKYCCVGLGLKVHERVETNEVEVLTKGDALEYWISVYVQYVFGPTTIACTSYCLER